MSCNGFINKADGVYKLNRISNKLLIAHA